MTDRRKVLEGIVNSPDPNVSARDRLDALARLDEHAPPPDPVLKLLAEIPLDEDALDAELDQLIGAEAVQAALSGDETRFPMMGAAIRHEIERRARELADADRIEAEIAARAEERAAQLYTDAGWRSLAKTLDNAAETAPPGSEATPPTVDPSEPLQPVQVPEGIDPKHGWPDRSRSRTRRIGR